MENKQKAIEKAYIKLLGEKLYSENKSIINFNDGTLKLKCGLKLPNKGLGFSFIGSFSDHSIVIPIELQGIETNNGWIKVESEDALPKNETMYWASNGDNVYNFCYTKDEFLEDYRKDKSLFTHYQPIIKPNPPIY